VALACNSPVPRPSRPLTDLAPAWCRLSNAVVTRPLTQCRWTCRSLSSRTRAVISPEVVSRRMSLCSGGLSRPQVSQPEMGRAVGPDHVEPPVHQVDREPLDLPVEGQPVRLRNRERPHRALPRDPVGRAYAQLAMYRNAKRDTSRYPR